MIGKWDEFIINQLKWWINDYSKDSEEIGGATSAGQCPGAMAHKDRSGSVRLTRNPRMPIYNMDQHGEIDLWDMYSQNSMVAFPGLGGGYHVVFDVYHVSLLNCD